MSTLVSNFELLFKPLTPALSPELATLGRRALQGYFLTLTNLESSTLVYTLEYRVSLPEPGAGAVGRRDLSHAVFISDVAGDNQFAFPVPNGGNLWTNTVSVPAGKTALTVLLPNVAPPGFFEGPSDIEIRGHVRVSVNCVRCRKVTKSKLGFGFCPQARRPVRVLASVEHRTTFLPNGWPVVAPGSLDFDQVGTSIALAPGRAEFTITPASKCSGFGKTLKDLSPEVLDKLMKGGGPLRALGEQGRALATLEAMALLASEGEEERRMVETLSERLGLGVDFGSGDEEGAEDEDPKKPEGKEPTKPGNADKPGKGRSSSR